MKYALWLLPLLAAGPVAAEPVGVRVGTHGGFGRVVFDFPQPQSFTSERTGTTLVLRFPGGGDVPDSPAAARNIAAVTGGGEMATVTIALGSRLRMLRIGTRVVVDVLDPVQARLANPPRPAASPAVPARTTAPPAQEPAASIVPATAPPAAPSASAPAPWRSADPPAASPADAAPPPTANAGPERTLALAATQTLLPVGISGVLLPFGPGVGAASFRHGEEAWIVFDDRRPLDLANLAGDPVFAGAAVELLPSATLLRLQLPPDRVVLLDRQADGWSVSTRDGPVAQPVTMPTARPDRLLFSVATPGQVVTVPDSDTGRNLLVGTTKSSGPGVPVTFHVPEFAIDPSWQGIVVEPVSDRTVLRTVPEGFALETGGALSRPSETGTALASAAILTRRFDLPAEPVATLLRRLQAQVQEEGQAPPQGRLAARKAAAQTMLALGLGPEAQSLLRMAITEDPRAASDADTSGLTAIAALLSGRPQEADGIDLPALSGSDEITLWRAVRMATLDNTSPAAAQAFSTTASLVLAYPAAVRSRLLPLAAETMVSGGAGKAADALLASLPDEPLLAFARAVRLEQKGDTDAALTLYDALATGRDRLSSARAATRATLLRLASGAIGPAEAADGLERSFGDWRGDSRERDLHVRTAGIAAQAGKWHKAFEILKETAQLFPDDATVISGRITALLSDLLHGPGASAIRPIDLVTLAEENASAIAKSDASGMALLLADKLTALDLPHRAGPVIAQMAAALPPGAGRAGLGARLASLRLAEGDVAGAAEALATTDAPDLPTTLQEERGLADARIHALSHDVSGAAAILAKLGTLAADTLRADVLGNSGDWHGAASALEDVVARSLPDNGPLSPEQQDLVLRLASARSRAGDDAAVHSLGVQEAGRMSGPRADMFRLLTSGPVGGVSDLPRVTSEVAMARALPTSLAALGAK